MEETTDITFGAVPKGHSAMATMGTSGDTKLIWDPRNDAECKAAEMQFNYLVKEKKYTAYKMLPEGERGDQIRAFDKNAERILMVPQMQGG